MDGEIDFTKYDEAELVAMFGRMDPRWVPGDRARLKELLLERGYLVHDGGVGPGFASPSPDKLQALIGSARPIECKVAFGQTPVPLGGSNRLTTITGSLVLALLWPMGSKCSFRVDELVCSVLCSPAKKSLRGKASLTSSQRAK